MLGVNVMSHQDLVFKLAPDQSINQANALSIAEKVNAWLDLII